MRSIETRSKSQIRVDAVQRHVMWHCCSGVTPYIRVAEYPKSGGTWLGQIISSYLGIAFPRNERPSVLRLQPCVLHGHHLYNPRVKNVVCIIRDGRDLLTSAYYHLLNHHRSMYVDDPFWQVLPSADYRDVHINMPAFIEYMFTRPTLGGRSFTRKQVSWRTFTDSWFDKDAIIVRYEDMLRDTPAAVTPLLRSLTGEEPDRHRLQEVARRFSFQNQSGRKPGEEDSGSFLRRGVAGDWKNKFTDEACQVFKYYAGDVLIRAGYETDHDWTATEPQEESSLELAMSM